MPHVIELATTLPAEVVGITERVESLLGGASDGSCLPGTRPRV